MKEERNVIAGETRIKKALISLKECNGRSLCIMVETGSLACDVM
jgi:hypothetical protein